MPQDLELAELMAARLCHDLVGPIGAVSNGVELLGDGGPPDPEVNALIAQSARQASRRLQWFRIAFGSANALPGSGILAETRRLASGLFEEGRVTLDWPAPDEAVEALASRQASKMLLNLALLALEALPRGGAVQARITPNGKTLSRQLVAQGQGARIPDEIQAAMRPGVSLGELTPKSVPAVLAVRVAEATGTRINTTSATDRVEFSVSLPAAA
jgi:histidine phosphotransferase ChpT